MFDKVLKMLLVIFGGALCTAIIEDIIKDAPL